MQAIPKPGILADPQHCAAEMLDVVPAIMRAIRGQVRSRSGLELSLVQIRTLAFLSHRPGASLSDVKDHIGITLPSASKLAQVLLMRGYLRRKQDVHDRRRSVLAPTSKGKRMLELARRATRDYLAARLSSLDENQRRIVLESMTLLRPIFLEDIL